MEVLRELMKKPRQTDTLAIGAFVVAMIYAIVAGTPHTIIAGIAFVLMVLGALPRQMTIAFLVGASVILLLQTSSKSEGFAGSGSGESEVEPTEGSPAAEEKKKEAETAEGFAGKKKPMLPDNATRKEPLVLGKAYTLPSEEDDKGYHLDAGTTFMNAYKSLKPDQIAAMTRDTQELLATQKSLVAMLDSFAPLMKDMDKITGFFK